MDIDTEDHLPISQKLQTLPLKHVQWVHEELEMLEKAAIISQPSLLGQGQLFLYQRMFNQENYLRNIYV